jgi:hypothetical protein
MEPQPESKKSTAIDFVKSKLAINPEATFAEIKAHAKVEGLMIYPVVYGRAKALLGLVPTAPYGSKSRARKERAEPTLGPSPAAVNRTPATAPAPRAPVGTVPVPNGVSDRTSRARDLAADSPSMASLESMIADLKTAVQERDRYRETLERIAEMIRVELGD